MTKKIIFVFFGVFFSIKVFGQKNTASPYSFFGIGEKRTDNTVEFSSMGGQGVSFSDQDYVNFINPAAQGKFNLTSFGAALDYKRSYFKTSDFNEDNNIWNLSYLYLGIPLGPKTGMLFGVKPYTSVGYRLISETISMTDPYIVSETSFYQGSGGTNQVFLSFGYTIGSRFRIGVEGAYIFGEIEKSVVQEWRNVQNGTKSQKIYNLSAPRVKFGIQYEEPINDKLTFNVGLTTELNQRIKAKGNEYLFIVEPISGIHIDTLKLKQSISVAEIPIKSAFGLGLGNSNKWYVGIDYSFQNPISLSGGLFNINDLKNARYQRYSKIAFGGYYTPSVNSITSYWERVTYRAGFRYENTGLSIKDIKSYQDFYRINDFGISFGTRFPVDRQLSNIEFGIEYGQLGTTNKGLIKENYLTFSIGLSVNERWFRKRRID